MEKDTHDNMVRKLEVKADELFSLMFAIAEQRLDASETIPPAVQDKALAAAALAVQEAVQTFIAVNRIE